MAKNFGYGSEITVTTTTAALLIGQVRSISGPGISADDIDTTCLDSSTMYRTFVPGLRDPGEVTLEVVYDSTALAMTRLSVYLNTSDNDLAVRTFTLYHGSSTGDSNAFTAYVKGLGREIPLDDLITGEITLKLTGTPGLTVS